MKYGDKVVLCWDGKLCRNVSGIITRTRNGNYIKVKFIPYLEDNQNHIESWFKLERTRYGKRVASGYSTDISTNERFGYYVVVRECNYMYRYSKYPERYKNEDLQ